jgi:hypothetical protein
MQSNGNQDTEDTLMNTAMSSIGDLHAIYSPEKKVSVSILSMFFL